MSIPGSEESKVGGEAQTVRLYMGMSGESRVERFAGSDPTGPSASPKDVGFILCQRLSLRVCVCFVFF